MSDLKVTLKMHSEKAKTLAPDGLEIESQLYMALEGNFVSGSLIFLFCPIRILYSISASSAVEMSQSNNDYKVSRTNEASLKSTHTSLRFRIYKLDILFNYQQ